MDRRGILLNGIEKDMVGIEIGPWHSPLVPKREGYRSLSLDVFDTQTLRKNASVDATIPKASLSLIEDVDLVGPASELGEVVESKGLAGKLDYVISSHNFEHIADPVRFLQGCEKALKPGGILSMAVPDKRGTFDYFRPHSITADFIAAFQECRKRPTNIQVLAMETLRAFRVLDGEEIITWNLTKGPDDVHPCVDVEAAYDRFVEVERASAAGYTDTHCWAFTPASFEVIIRDIHYLGLTKMGLENLRGPNVFEFYARLTNGKPRPSSYMFYECRGELLRKIAREYAVAAADAAPADAPAAVIPAATDIAASADIAALREEISALRSSTSWRVTAPLRKLRTAFGL